MPKWIRFDKQETPPERKTNIWHVVSTFTGVRLGEIRWYGQWRKYTFQPENRAMVDLIFEEDCLRDIAEFIEAETRKYRALKSCRGGN